MKISTMTLLPALTAATMFTGSATAAVVAVGEDTTTLGNWRTAAALQPDNEYGTDGYVLYGINEADGVFTAGYNASSLTTAAVASNSQVVLPSYIGDIAFSLPAAGGYGMWSGNGNTGQIQDPGNGNAPTNTPMMVNGADPYTFTFTRQTSDAFILTIILNDVDGQDYTWNTNVNAGSAGSDVIFGTTDNGPNNATYHVYEVGAGSDNIVVTTDSSGFPGRVVGFAFDPIPEPSSLALLGLGGLLVARRRR